MTIVVVLVALVVLSACLSWRKRRAERAVKPPSPVARYRYSKGMEKADPKIIDAIGARRMAEVLAAQDRLAEQRG